MCGHLQISAHSQLHECPWPHEEPRLDRHTRDVGELARHRLCECISAGAVVELSIINKSNLRTFFALEQIVCTCMGSSSSGMLSLQVINWKSDSSKGVCELLKHETKNKLRSSIYLVNHDWCRQSNCYWTKQEWKMTFCILITT